MSTPTPSPFDLTLAHKAMFSVSDASGVQITCHTGSLWVTLDDDPRDVVLNPGDSFLTTEHRRALIYAMEESSLRVGMMPAAVPKSPAARGRVAAEARVSFALQAAA
ncbi:MAG: DUF2917 domain-containing protein [Pseudomonadota bacterium]